MVQREHCPVNVYFVYFVNVYFESMFSGVSREGGGTPSVSGCSG